MAEGRTRLLKAFRQKLRLGLIKKSIATVVTASLLVNIAQLSVYAADPVNEMRIREQQKQKDNVYVPSTQGNTPASMMGTGAQTYTVDGNNMIVGPNGNPVGFVNPETKEAYRVQKDGSFKKDDYLTKQIFGEGKGKKGSGPENVMPGEGVKQGEEKPKVDEQKGDEKGEKGQKGQDQQQQQQQVQPKVETYKEGYQQQGQMEKQEGVESNNEGIKKAQKEQSEYQMVAGKKRDDGSQSVVNMQNIQDSAANQRVILAAVEGQAIEGVVGQGYVIAHFQDKETGKGKFATIAPDGKMSYMGSNGEIVVTTWESFKGEGRYSYSGKALVIAKTGMAENVSHRQGKGNRLDHARRE
jgi:hypothetical protein